MRSILSFCCCVLFAGAAHAQITITNTDMPVVGDTLRWSAALVAGSNINFTTTGANTTWDYSNLVAINQGVDEYKTAAQVNIAYAVVISPTAYGYKVADSIAGIGTALPVTVNNVYSFFSKKTGPGRYVAEGFAATVSSLPTPAAYTDEDEIYFLPLTYPDSSTSTFRLKASIATVGSYAQQGTRKTNVDGWGTIKTPFYSSPAAAIRVRSEITEIDSVTFLTQSFVIPRRTVEYKWLVNGDHYPALVITTNKTATTETPSSIRYRDSKRPLAIGGISTPVIAALNAYPNPATNTVTVNIPATIKHYSLELWDVTGKLLSTTQDVATIDIAALPRGQYLVRATADNWTGFAKVVK